MGNLLFHLDREFEHLDADKLTELSDLSESARRRRRPRRRKYDASAADDPASCGRRDGVVFHPPAPLATAALGHDGRRALRAVAHGGPDDHLPAAGPLDRHGLAQRDLPRLDEPAFPRGHRVRHRLRGPRARRGQMDFEDGSLFKNEPESVFTGAHPAAPGGHDAGDPEPASGPAVGGDRSHDAGQRPADLLPPEPPVAGGRVEVPDPLLRRHRRGPAWGSSSSA